MGMAAGGGSGAKSDINVTPLVDVCLVLLIIFMVLVPRNVPEISVRIPPESKVKRPPPEGDRPLVVAMDKDGGLTLNQRGYEKEELTKEVERQMEGRAKKVVFVDFDHKAEYGEAVQVIDLIKTAGAEVVGIMRARDYVMPDTLDKAVQE